MRPVGYDAGKRRASGPPDRRRTMPDAAFTRALILRAAVLWLGVRMLIAFSGLMTGRLLLPTGVSVSVLIIAATVFLAGLELRRRNEFLFLGSLGHAPAFLLMLSALPIAPLEVLFTAALP
jgi:hypothetical protein